MAMDKMKRRLGGSERGSVVILAAFATAALLSIGVLSIDASYMYDQRNRLSAAADAERLRLQRRRKPYRDEWKRDNYREPSAERRRLGCLSS